MRNILEEKVTSSKAAKLFGVTAGAIRYWELKGWLVPERTEGGHRRYSLKQLMDFNERRKEIELLELNQLGGK